MKRFIAIALTLLQLLLLKPGLAQEKLITGPSAESSAVQVYGVESAPQKCTYADFRSTFTRFMQKNFGCDASFVGPFYSDGYWVYIMHDGASCMRVKAAGKAEDAPIQEIDITADAENAGDLAVLCAAGMFSAAKCGQMGQYVLNLLIFDQTAGFFDQNIDFWRENGFQLSMGKDAFGMAFGKIRFSEALPVEDPIIINWDNLTPLPQPLTPDALGEAIARRSPMLGMEAPVFPEAYEESMGYQIYSFLWEDCAVVLSKNGETGHVKHLMIASTTGDTNSLWGRALLLYFAAVQAQDEEVVPLSLLTGGSGGWDILCAMNPYVCLRGTALRCFADEETGMPYAIICGASEAE